MTYRVLTVSSSYVAAIEAAARDAGVSCRTGYTLYQVPGNPGLSDAMGSAVIEGDVAAMERVAAATAQLPREQERWVHTQTLFDVVCAVIRIRGCEEPRRVVEAVRGYYGDPEGMQRLLLAPDGWDPADAALARAFLAREQPVMRRDFLPLTAITEVPELVAMFWHEVRKKKAP